VPGVQAAKHALLGPEPAVAKPEGHRHCSCAPELTDTKLALHVQLAGPPVAVEPSGQDVHVKTVGVPVWKVLFGQKQKGEPAEGATAPGGQLVQTLAAADTAAYVCAGQMLQLTGGPLSSHERSPGCAANVVVAWPAQPGWHTKR
jgi:hypothetical protein